MEMYLAPISKDPPLFSDVFTAQLRRFIPCQFIFIGDAARLAADYHYPGTHLPFGDQSTLHVRIVLGKLFGNGGTISPEY